MRTRITLVIFSILSALTTCLVMAGAAVAVHPVPFKAWDTGSFTMVAAATSGHVHTADRATGHGTHLGRYHLVASEDIDLASLAVTDGSFTLTAADGSTVSGTYSGEGAQASASTITYRVSGPVTGGTGRFTGVTGFLTWAGGADLGGGTLFDRVTGTLSLPH